MATQLTVEDMLEKSKGLPSEVRRSMDLLRILDTRWMSHRHTADQLQRAYISDMRGRLEGLPRDGSVDLRKISEDSDALAKVMSTQQDLIQISEEKCSVARQVYESVSCALEKMAVDLKRFEVELKVNGDWKEEQAPNYAEIDEDNDEYEVQGGRGGSGRGGFGGGRMGRGSLAGNPRGSGVGLDEYAAQHSGGDAGGLGGFMGGSGGGFEGSGSSATGADGSMEDTTLYCVCRKAQTGCMVACDNDKCKTPDEWYHNDCMNLPEQGIPEGDKWHCPGCSRRPGGQRWSATGTALPPVTAAGGTNAALLPPANSALTGPSFAQPAAAVSLDAQRSQALQAQQMLLVQHRAQQAADNLVNSGITLPKTSHKAKGKK